MHILVVDDERHIRFFLERYLTTRGHRVTPAANGADALRVIRDAPGEFDVVVLDNMLPVMNGPDVLDVLRRENVKVPVILMSGYVREGLMDRQRYPALLGMLEKPFAGEALDDLLHRAETAWRRERTDRP